jgi:hypothetical protein
MKNAAFSVVVFLARVIYSVLKMKATRSSETSVCNKPTRRHIPEDDILHCNLLVCNKIQRKQRRKFRQRLRKCINLKVCVNSVPKGGGCVCVSSTIVQFVWFIRLRFKCLKTERMQVKARLSLCQSTRQCRQLDDVDASCILQLDTKWVSVQFHAPAALLPSHREVVYYRDR